MQVPVAYTTRSIVSAYLFCFIIDAHRSQTNLCEVKQLTEMSFWYNVLRHEVQTRVNRVDEALERFFIDAPVAWGRWHETRKLQIILKRLQESEDKVTRVMLKQLKFQPERARCTSRTSIVRSRSMPRRSRMRTLQAVSSFVVAIVQKSSHSAHLAQRKALNEIGCLVPKSVS